jgi:hypothetical protein
MSEELKMNETNLGKKKFKLGVCQVSFSEIIILFLLDQASQREKWQYRSCKKIHYSNSI